MKTWEQDPESQVSLCAGMQGGLPGGRSLSVAESQQTQESQGRGMSKEWVR